MLGEKSLRPADVQEQSDGVCRRPVVRYAPDGKPYNEMKLCCERCWEPVPAYVDAPHGYVSPASNSKLHFGSAEGRGAIEARQKIVCYDCYAADARDLYGAFDDFPHTVKE